MVGFRVEEGGMVGVGSAGPAVANGSAPAPPYSLNGSGAGGGGGGGGGNGNGGGGEELGMVHRGGAGTPMRVQSAPIMRTKAVNKVNKDDYSWDEEGDGGQGGVTGKLADWLVSGAVVFFAPLNHAL